MHRACIAIVDAAHARLYSSEPRDGDEAQLREERDLVSPGRQAHGRFSDKPARAPGGNHAAKDDHRDDNLHEQDARFARDVIGEIDRIVRERAYGQVIVVASPKMLGELRRVDARLRRDGLVLDEVQQDLAWLWSPQLHDQLAAHGLLEPRARAHAPGARRAP
jgi:protein required for attachment to host cells